jgi:hypothetical protein
MHEFAHDDMFWRGRDRMNKWKFYGEYWKTEGRDAFKKYVEKHEQEMRGNEESGSQEKPEDGTSPEDSKK